MSEFLTISNQLLKTSRRLDDVVIHLPMQLIALTSPSLGWEKPGSHGISLDEPTVTHSSKVNECKTVR